MNAKQLVDAEADLSAEVAQYKVVVAQFKKLGFSELSQNAEQKRDLLMTSLHRLRETMHAIGYQELRDLVIAAKNNGDFNLVKQHLVGMQNITRAQQKVEKEGKEKDHAKRLAGILAELDENMAINDFFIEYKDLEGSYNKARGAVARGSFREAHEVASQRIPRVQRLHERLEGLIVKKSDLQILFDDVVKLQGLYDQLEVAVQNGYKQMLDGSAVAPVRLEAFTATLELPSLSDIGKNRDLGEIIAYLDAQFSKWEENKGKQG
jgi:hypothetical protein